MLPTAYPRSMPGGPPNNWLRVAESSVRQSGPFTLFVNSLLLTDDEENFKTGKYGLGSTQEGGLVTDEGQSNSTLPHKWPSLRPGTSLFLIPASTRTRSIAIALLVFPKVSLTILANIVQTSSFAGNVIWIVTRASTVDGYVDQTSRYYGRNRSLPEEL